MQCDICGQDVGNSDQLEKHKEQMHPTDEGEKSIDNLEKPDHLGETPEQSATSEAPRPQH